MKRVYMINLSFGVAGIERRFVNIWRLLNQRGHYDVRLVIPDTLGQLLYQAGLINPEDPKIWLIREPTISRWTRRVNWGKRADMLVAALRSRIMARAYRLAWAEIVACPDAIVHIGLNCSGLVPPQVPLVYECVDSTLTQLGTRHYIRAASRRCIVHCQSERIRQALESTHQARRPLWRTEVSRNCFAIYPEKPTTASRSPELVAFVGRFSEDKNPILFVEAIARARERGVFCRALMLGEGPLKGAIETRIRTLELEDHFRVAFVADPAIELAQAAIYVSLQTGDNYPSQALLEAMGAGCAVIASDVGETKRLVTPAVGVCCAPDVDSVAAAIARMVQDPANTAAMGTAAAAHARANFSADVYISFVEELYRQACSYFLQSDGYLNSDHPACHPGVGI